MHEQQFGAVACVRRHVPGALPAKAVDAVQLGREVGAQRMRVAIGLQHGVADAVRIRRQGIARHLPHTSVGRRGAQDVAPAPAERRQRATRGRVDVGVAVAVREGEGRLVVHFQPQPFKPPEVRPLTTFSWKITISTTMGTMATTSAAEMIGHGKANSPWYSWMPTGSVR